jgi:predicted DNA-binding protein
MSLSIRLDQDTETALQQHVQRVGITRSAFVREAIREKLAKHSQTSTPYQLGASLFGRHASGDNDRSLNRKSLLRERFDAKHRS